jgi:DNA-binding CsgD family transcriptional regulator
MDPNARFRARDRLRTVDASSADAVFRAILDAFHDVARFDWSAIMTVDPDTFLPSGGIVEGFSAESCAPFWDNELLDADFVKFADLARSRDPVATLFETVDGDLERSPRYRRLYRPLGAGDELRVAFVTGGACLGIGALVRCADDGVFGAAEIADVRELLPTACAALRRAQRTVARDTLGAPVVVIFDADGRRAGVTAGSEEVLDDLRLDIDGELPGMVQVAVTKARTSRTATSLTTLLRGRSGRWMRLHVAPMDDGAGSVAVTVEPARPDDLARVLIDSYGLTPRETEIVLRLCRGLTTGQIADELVISAHTVRDHVKAIYEKAGVGSRGELVAILFADHVLDRFHDSVVHVA